VNARSFGIAARVPATPRDIIVAGPSRTRPWLLAAHVTLLTGAAALWVLSLTRVRISDMAGHGLIDALPASYYVAFGLLLIGFAAAMQRDPLPARLLWAYVLAFIGFLHATGPLLYDDPRFAWTYKHLGVIDLIAKTGATDRHVDIYNNWPGFFALNAWLSTAGGVAPIAYAAWAPLLLTTLDVLVVRFALRGLSNDARLLWTATWIFVLANWNGGDYLAPQGFGFAIGVSIVGICLRCRLPRRPRPRWREHVLGRLVRWPARPLLDWLRSRLPARDDPAPEPVLPPMRAGAALALGAVCFLAVVVSHQLSPVMVIAAVCGLALAARKVPLWVPAVMVAVEGWWVFLALPFLSGRFDLLAFDPLARPPTGATGTIGLPGLELHGVMLRGLFAVMALLAVIGAIRRWCSGHRDLAVGVLIIAPAAIDLIQPYGGEGTFRAFLFALPWLSFFAAAACRPERARAGIARGASTLRLLFVTAAITALMLYVFFGLELVNRIDRDDVRASAWYETHAPPGSMSIYLAPNFPGRLSFRYASLYAASGPPSPSLTEEPGFTGHDPGPGVTRIIDRVFRRNGKSRGFVVLNDSQERYSRLYGLLPSGSFARVERILSDDPAFRLVYRTAGARIWAYRFRRRPHG
jgi:hypothetical protein